LKRLNNRVQNKAVVAYLMVVCQLGAGWKLAIYLREWTADEGEVENEVGEMTSL